jgi:uncharacterized protein
MPSQENSVEAKSGYQSPGLRFLEAASPVRFVPIERIHTTSYFPDLNVWLALSWAGHLHSPEAWRWFRSIPANEVLFCRWTQIGLLRLLTTQAVMGDDCLTVKKAWSVYDQWLCDPKVGMTREPAEVDDLFRHSTAAFAQKSSPKALGDCYLLAFARALRSTIVTLDGGMCDSARRLKQEAILL